MIMLRTHQKCIAKASLCEGHAFSMILLKLFDLCNVCCSIASPDNALLMLQLTYFVEDVDLNATCRAGMLFLNSVGGSLGTFLTATADDCQCHSLER